jgi:hypothetical protein
MARSRAGKGEFETCRSMRLSICRVTTLACLPGMAMFSWGRGDEKDGARRPHAIGMGCRGGDHWRTGTEDWGYRRGRHRRPAMTEAAFCSLKLPQAILPADGNLEPTLVRRVARESELGEFVSSRRNEKRRRSNRPRGGFDLRVERTRLGDFGRGFGRPWSALRIFRISYYTQMYSVKLAEIGRKAPENGAK